MYPMYRRFASFFSSHVFFFLIGTACILTLNLIPLFRHINNSPPGRTFAMIHNNAQDFFFYQSLMNQGANGAWLTSDSFTTEAHKPSIIFAYFLWLGKLAAVFSIPFPIMYHALRILFGFLTLLAAYCLLRTAYASPRLTFFFFLFAAPFLHKIPDGATFRTVPFMHWWTGMDPIRRSAYLPHHMIGAFLLVFSMLLFIRYYTKNSRSSILIAIGCIPLLTFFHTPSLFILLVTLPVTVLLYAVRTYFGKKYTFLWNKGTIRMRIHSYSIPWRALYHPMMFTGTYMLFGFACLYAMVSQTGQGFPWSQYIEWERRLQFPLDKELVAALGILFPLSLVGIVPALVGGSFGGLLAVAWLFVPIICIPLAPILGLSNVRLIQGVPYLPLAILAVIGMEGIQTLFHKFSILNFQFLMNVHFFKFQIKKLIGLFGYWAIGLLFVVYTYPTLEWSLKDQIREYMPIYGNIYFDNRMQNAFAYINTHYPAGTHVLSTFYTGNYLPAFTHTTSFVGHTGYTQRLGEKEPLTGAFFSQTLPEKDARRLLQDNTITLVFQGPEEMPIFSGMLYPNLLSVVYDADPVRIYEVKR